jgi:hypothetical protein
MREFSKEIDIDMRSLDFILWYKETKEVFKWEKKQKKMKLRTFWSKKG